MGGACFLKKPEAGKTEALGAGQRALLREREENKAGDNWERRLKLLQAEKSRREISHPTSGNPRLRVQANLPEETKGKEKPKQSPTGLSQRSRFGPTRFFFFFLIIIVFQSPEAQNLQPELINSQGGKGRWRFILERST